MKNEKILKSEKGSILMEYVIINFLVAMPALGFFHTQFYNISTSEFIGFGLDFVEYMQRLSSAISAPIP